MVPAAFAQPTLKNLARDSLQQRNMPNAAFNRQSHMPILGSMGPDQRSSIMSRSDNRGAGSLLPLSQAMMNPVFVKNDYSKPERYMRQIIDFIS